MSKTFNFAGTLQENGKRVVTDLTATAQSVSYDEVAEVVVERTEEGANFTFKLPTGQPGPQGPEGPQGEPGQAAKSPYDLWLELGNEGDAQDFLDYLKAGPSYTDEEIATAAQETLDLLEEG